MYLDIILILPVLWGMFKGFRKGFIIELCTLMALILGVYGAATFGDMGAEYLEKSFNTEPRVSLVLAFTILFIGIVVAVFLFGKALEGVIKLVALGLVNKLFGLLFGGLKFLLLTSGLLFIINGFPLTARLIPEEQKNESYLYEFVEPVVPKIYPILTEESWPEKINEKLDSLKEGI